MFEFLFKYPASLFSRGTFVLLGSWPRWVLVAAIGLAFGALAWRMWHNPSTLVRSMSRARALVLWLLQGAMLASLLLLLWEPAISVTALRPQQNIVALVIDDSRSMGLSDTGSSREQEAIKLLKDRLIPNLQKRFQLRFYRLSGALERIPDVEKLHASGSATRIGGGLRQLADEAATLPVGAVVLLSDGGDNAGRIDTETLAELQRRRIPVNTIGFGRESLVDDVELDRLDVPAKVLQNSRLRASVTLRQNGFAGKRAHLVVVGDGRLLASRDITLASNPEQTETVEFNAGKSGVRSIEARIDPLPGETNRDNNRLTRTIAVDGTKRRILYVEGEPRWEFKFLRRAVEDDPAIEIVSMLRTTQNKIYRQGIATQSELADGFPTKMEDLFRYQGLIFGSVESSFFTRTQQDAIKQFVDRRGGGAAVPRRTLGAERWRLQCRTVCGTVAGNTSVAEEHFPAAIRCRGTY